MLKIFTGVLPEKPIRKLFILELVLTNLRKPRSVSRLVIYLLYTFFDKTEFNSSMHVKLVTKQK